MSTLNINNDYIHLNSASSDKVVVEGDLGVGASSPGSKLEVSSSGAEGILISKDTVTTSNSGRLFFETDTVSEGFSFLNSNGLMTIRSQAQAGATSGNIRVAINGSGSVGIGTSSPQQKLHVDGNIYLGPNNSNNFIHSGGALGLQADGEVKIVSDVNDSAGQGAADIIFGYGSSTNTDSNQDFTEAELF